MTEATLPKTAAAPQEQLLQMITGYWVTQAVGVAAKLRLADMVAQGPRPLAELAEAAHVDAEGMYRLMRALTSVGLFQEVGPGLYAQSPMSECLRAEAPGSLRDMAIMNANPSHYQTWGHLEHAIRTNETVFDKLFGCDVFSFLAEQPEEARAFNGAMTNLSGLAARAVAEAYDFTGITRLCDVGGGHGFLLSSLLQAFPHLNGVLYDLPHVVSGAPVAPRLAAVGGNFFEDVPAGCDAYLMKHILHDWSDERCQVILGHCARALPPGGKVLLVELVVPEAPGPHFSKFADLNMLVMTPGGRERSESQFRALFERAGLRLNRMVPTASPFCVIEAIKG